MPVHFVHAPYMQESRDKLLELQQSGADFIYTERWTAADDDRYDFTDDLPYIHALPSILLLDDDQKTVLCRASHLDHINAQNVRWMQMQHSAWKQGGKKNKFPIPPWSNGGG